MTKAKQNSSRQIAKIVRTTRDIPMPVANAGSLELTVGMGDLRAMAIAEVRERLLQAREVADALLKEAQVRLGVSEQKLIQAAQQLWNDFKPPAEAVTVAAAITCWLQKECRFRFESIPPSYSYGEKRKNTEPVVDVEQKQLTASLRFQVTDQNSTTFIHDLDKPMTVDFTPEMVAIVAAIEGHKADIELARRDLTDINRQLAELPHKGDQIQSALTKAHLTGQLTDSGKILEVIRNSVNILTLPGAVKTRMLLENKGTDNGTEVRNGQHGETKTNPG